MKVIVCGGRGYKNRQEMRDRLKKLPADAMIIAGGQVSKDFITGELFGADYLAEEVGFELGFLVKVIRADWRLHGKAAGPIRNREMLGEEPDLVIAFPGGRGTADMVRIAEEAGIPVERVK